MQNRKGRLIALYSPAAGSGKSVVAGVLESRFGYSTVKFAGPLKDMVRGLLRGMGITHATIERMVEGDLKETVVPGFETVTPRHLMQTLGTDWGREAVDKDLWLKVACAKIEKLLEGGIDVVVDDLRFPNEMKALWVLGGTLVKIVRPDAPKVGSTRYEALLDDAAFDLTIENTGTLRELELRAANLAQLVQATAGM
jgi:hypothetical protein